MTAPRRIGPRPVRHAAITAMVVVVACLFTAFGCDRAGAQTPPASSDGVRFQGRIVRDFSAPDDNPMLLPSDVAVTADGRVFVADGTHDRIVCFDATGRVERLLDGAPTAPLSRPLGLCVDNGGRVWVADTGHARVVVFDREGRVETSFPVGPEGSGDTVDLTDVVLTSDGRAALGVDNHHHRLLRIDLNTRFVSTFGAFGQALGQFDHPFLIASDGRGRAFVTDVINGRAVALTDDGEASAVISGFGVDLGRVYRPKGVACDAQGRVWIGDGRLGVVQAFTGQGKWIDVLRGEDGRPMQFEAPCGMSFGQTGDLYIVESRRAHVVQVDVREDPSVPQIAPPPVITGRQPQACAVCHIEWVAPLVEGRGTALMSLPDNPPDYPLVSRPENCQSCHDGSVTDARRKVWVEHGHRYGVVPPEDIHVPASLPLVDGQIVCRTCHSAHTRGGSGNLMKDAVFLRVSSDPNQLCVTCHVALTTGAAEGMHPLICAPVGAGGETRKTTFVGTPDRSTYESGGRPDLPNELTAPTGSAAGTTECLTCHAPHGSERDALLKTPDGPESLCLKCHSDVTHGAAGAAAHPVTGALDAEQSAAVLKTGARPRWTESLGCLACHSVHRAPSPPHLLRAPIDDGQLCLTCHADKSSVTGTSHDLRQAAPEQLALLGRPVADANPCAACHAPHPRIGAGASDSPVVLPAPSDGPAADAFSLADDNGSCARCHRPDGCAQNRTGQPFGHPVAVTDHRLEKLRADFGREHADSLSPECLTCRDCHDPHRAEHGRFLRSAAEDLCATCHADKPALDFGPHDFLGKEDQLNRSGQNAAQTGRCGSCHAIHQSDGPMLWAGTSDRLTSAQDACLSCHRVGGRGAAKVPTALLHPVAAPDASMRAAPSLPLFDDRGRRSCDGRVSCATCHDPHAPPTASAMLRGRGGPDRSDLCAMCHAQAETLAASPHNSHAWEDHSSAGLTCSPCHAVHAPPQWAGDSAGWVAPRGAPDARAADALLGADLCTGCHRADGLAKRDVHAAHPRIYMSSLSRDGGMGSLPLLDDQGRLGPRGFLTCQTCHAPHGTLTTDDAHVLRGLDATGAVLRNSKPMLRPYVAPNLCTQCHGFEGLSRFLLFHRWSNATSAVASIP